MHQKVGRKHKKKGLKSNLQQLIERYRQLGIDQQIDYDKFYLYSLITHSTAIEGSTITEVENQIMFDLPAKSTRQPYVTSHRHVVNLILSQPAERNQQVGIDYTTLLLEPEL